MAARSLPKDGALRFHSGPAPERMVGLQAARGPFSQTASVPGMEGKHLLLAPGNSQAAEGCVRLGMPGAAGTLREKPTSEGSPCVRHISVFDGCRWCRG